MAGMNLKEWLTKESMTQAEFAAKAKMKQRTVSHIINGGTTSNENHTKIYEATDGEVTPNWTILGKAA